MSQATATQAAWQDEEGAAPAPAGAEVEGFLSAFSTMLRESIVRFEQTAGRITDMIVTQPGTTDRDLVMTLQEFDRLQQEFAALGGVLERFASHPAKASPDQSGRADTAIAEISLTDVKERFAQHLRATADTTPPEEFEEVIF